MHKDCDLHNTYLTCLKNSEDAVWEQNNGLLLLPLFC